MRFKMILVLIWIAACLPEADLQNPTDPAFNPLLFKCELLNQCTSFADSTPSLPVSGAVLWLRSDYNVAQDSSSRVTAWTSLAGSATLMPLDGDLGPNYSADAINGQPALSFDGTTFLASDGSVISRDGTTIYVVAHMKNPGSANQSIFAHSAFTDVSGTNVLYQSSVSTNQLFWFHEYNNGVNVSMTTTGLAVANQWSWFGWIRDATVPSLEFRYNDTSETIGFANNATDGKGTRLYIAASSLDNNITALDLAEVIVYASQLWSSDLRLVECYIADRYGFAIAGC